MPRTIKKEAKEDKTEKVRAPKAEKSFGFGLLAGLGGAVVLVAVIVAVVFWVSPRNSRQTQNSNQAGENQTADAAKLRFTIVAKKDCPECFDIGQLTAAIKQANVEITGEETVYWGEAAGDKLIADYKIAKLPTLLVAGELDKNTDLQGMWQALGEVVDGVFVFRQVIPPYVDVATGALKGLISVTYLTDQSCEKCYDVNLHKNALINLGVNPTTEKTVDISTDEGKALVKKYEINLVPTILLQGEVGEYQAINQIWSQYGAIKDDGTYVFTGMEAMGTYKDLAKKKVIEVDLNAAANNGVGAGQ